MTQETLVKAKSVLIAFMTAMNKWESELYSLKRRLLEGNASTILVAEIDKKAKQDLERIFKQWLVPGRGKRDRLLSLNCSNPPCYDPGKEVIEKVEDGEDKIIFYTRQLTGLRSNFRYTLKLNKENWKLLKKELLDDRDKWILIGL